MTPEITAMLLQATLSILAIVAASIFVAGIVFLSLLVEWHFFPLSRPGAGDDNDHDTILKSKIKNPKSKIQMP